MLTWCNSCLIYRALKTESFKSLQFTTLVESSYSQNTWTTMKVEYVSGKSLSLSLSLSLSHTHFVMGCRGLIPQQCPREQQGQLWSTIMVVKSNGQQGISSFYLLVSYIHLVGLELITSPSNQCLQEEEVLVELDLIGRYLGIRCG